MTTVVGGPMLRALAIVREEHKSMGAVLKGLQSHVEAVCEGRANPDFPLFQAMFDYIEAGPDRVHRARGSAVLLRLLRRRTLGAETLVDEIEGQQDACARMLVSVRSAMEAARAGGDIGSLATSLDTYAEFLWAHMRSKEEVVLPLAERHLADEDWEVIHAAFLANRNQAW